MKNKTKLAITHFIGMAITTYLVKLAHGVYENNPGFIKSLFFPVNESMWEHNKLFFLPCIVVFIAIYLIIGRKYKNYIPATALCIIYMPIMSFSIFQIYMLISDVHHEHSGIIVASSILLFGFLVSYFMTISEKQISKKSTIIILLGAFIMFVSLIVFTFYPPQAKWLEWLFMDSLTFTYGIPQ